MISSTSSCPLCQSSPLYSIRTQLKRSFFRCSNCDLVFLNPSERLSTLEEKARYETHENDVTDTKYQEFVSPLVNWITGQLPRGSSGLDFGAGTGPILATELEKHGFKMDKYDPFFWPDQAPLGKSYDFVVASEVVEHFADPKKEFELLKRLIKPGGILGLMTLLHDAKTEIENWYYLKDPTHICAYSEKTFEWLRKNLSFTHLSITLPRLIVLIG